MPGRPINLLVVAGWYPSVIDPVAGRFVADQAEALAATGAVRPAVASFDPADLLGSGALRARTAGTIRRLAGEAIRRRPDVFAGPGASIPVARLPIPGGRDPSAGPTHAAASREAALDALADRWLAGREVLVAVPDVLHAHTVYPDGAAAARLARRLEVPLVLTEHASFVARLVAEPEVRARYVATVREAGRLVVVSRTLAAELATTLPEIEGLLTVVPNAVRLDDLRPAARRERRPDELLFVGYRKASKGIDTLLAAVALVRRERPTVTLRLIGSAPTEAIEAGWRRRVAALGLDGAVLLEPSSDRAGVAAALQRASLFVHPSPRETFGVVAAEALGAGLPVVAADSGGVTEILGEPPGAVGAIVRPDDPAALASAIAATLERIDSFDPGALRASVAARMGADVVADRLVELYRGVLAGRAPRAPAPPSGPPEPPGHRNRVVVALDAGRAVQVDRLPASLRAGLVLATSRGASPGRPDGLAAVVEGDLGERIRSVSDSAAIGRSRGWRRVASAIRHPMAVARRRGWLPGLRRAIEREGAATVRRAIAAAVQAAGARAEGGRMELVCVDGVDYLAAESVVADGEADLAPGGLRWLGDLGQGGDG